MLDTQSVGSVTLSITPYSSMLSSPALTSSLRWIEHRLTACITGVTVGSRVMWKSPLNYFPIPSKRSGYWCCRSSYVFVSAACVISQFSTTRLRSRHDGSPMIAGPGVSSTKNIASHLFAACEHLRRSVPYWGIGCPL